MNERTVAGSAADRIEHLRSGLNGRGLLGGQRIDESEARELNLGGRAGLGREVHAERGDVANRELVGHAVAVAIHIVAGCFDRLHPNLVVRGAAVEFAHRRDAAFPLERPHDQVLVDADDVRGVQRNLTGRCFRARHFQRTEVDALCHQRHRHRLPRRARLRARCVAKCEELTGHFFGDALHGAEREDMRRVSLNELLQVAEVERVADHVTDRGSRSVIEQLEMTGIARHGVRSGRARRRVTGPLAGTGEIRSRHAGEAAAVADVGAGAVEGVEFGLEQLVAVLERFVEGRIVLARLDQRHQLRLIEVLTDGGVHALEQRHVGDDRAKGHGAGEEQRDDADQHDRASG